MAKKIWIETWYPRDEHIFSAFAVCGALQKEDMQQYVKGEKRIKDYTRDGYIKKDTDPKTGQEFYKLTDKGRDLCRDRYDREPVSFHSWTHESGLRDMYFQLSKDERLQQMSEPELQREIARDIEIRKQSDDEYERERAEKFERDYSSGKISCPDFGILRFNEQTREVEVAEFHESITSNYTDAEIQAKFDFASSYGGSLETAYV